MNLLLIVLDCLRRDFWLEKMPKTQAATTGWFHLLNHWSVAHCSDPNHAALFTGYGPWETGVTTQMGKAWKTALPTIFWRWQQHERRGTTWAVQPIIVPRFYRDNVELLAWHKGTESSDLECRAVKQFIDESKGKWLGFIRSMTCHYPYLDMPMPPRGSGGDIRPQYEAAVAHEDQFIENVIGFILNKCPNTIIVVTADHGELLGEHGEYDHLYTLYSELVRVPLAMYVPGLEGKTARAPTQHIDIVPTLCDLLEMKPQGEGESFADWMRDGRTRPVPMRALQLQGTGAGPVNEAEFQANGGRAIDPGYFRTLWRHRGVVFGQHKLVEDVHADGDRHERFTDENDEPINGQRKIRRRLARSMPAVPDYHPFERDALRRRNDQIVLRRLRALGYA